MLCHLLSLITILLFPFAKPLPNSNLMKRDRTVFMVVLFQKTLYICLAKTFISLAKHFYFLKLLFYTQHTAFVWDLFLTIWHRCSGVWVMQKQPLGAVLWKKCTEVSFCLKTWDAVHSIILTEKKKYSIDKRDTLTKLGVLLKMSLCMGYWGIMGFKWEDKLRTLLQN